MVILREQMTATFPPNAHNGITAIYTIGQGANRREIRLPSLTEDVEELEVFVQTEAKDKDAFPIPLEAVYKMLLEANATGEDDADHRFAMYRWLSTEVLQIKGKKNRVEIPEEVANAVRSFFRGDGQFVGHVDA